MLFLLPFLELLTCFSVVHVLASSRGGLVALIDVALYFALTAAVGLALVREAGTGLARSLQELNASFETSTGSRMSSRLAFFAAGLLLAIPGFLSDLVALLVLFPPTRAMLWQMVQSWLRRQHEAGRVAFHVNIDGAPLSSERGSRSSPGDVVIDAVSSRVDGAETDRSPRRLPEKPL